jgi:hypothetical protein
MQLKSQSTQEKVGIYNLTKNGKKRGRPSNSEDGYGSINPDGYRRVWDNEQKRLRFEHVLVWEANFGPVPEGMQVHHRNEDRLDNRIENLMLVDPLTHRRLHSGCFHNGVDWVKPCTVCGEYKLVSKEYYVFQRKGNEFIDSLCKCCRKALVTSNAIKRKNRLS